MFHWPTIRRKSQPKPSDGQVEQLAANLPHVIDPNVVPRSDGVLIPPGDEPHVRVMTLAEAGLEEHQHHKSSFDFVDAVLVILLIGAATIASLTWNRRGARERPSLPAVVSPIGTRGSEPTSRSFASPSAAPKPQVSPNSDERRQKDSTDTIRAVPDSAPRPVFTVPASYTDQARYANYRTKVYVVVTVSKEGLPARIEMTAPLSFDLEPAVRQAVAQWRFMPAMRGGQAVEAKAVYEVPFR